MLCGSVTTITGTEDALMKSLLCSLGLLLLSTLAAYSADEKLAKPTYAKGNCRRLDSPL
jgi:hypothetical protein